MTINQFPDPQTIWLRLLKGGATRKYRDHIALAVRDYINEINPIEIQQNSYLKDAYKVNKLLEQSGLSKVHTIFTPDQIKKLRSDLTQLKVEYINAKTAKSVGKSDLREDIYNRPDIHYATYSCDDLLKNPIINSIITNEKIALVPYLYLGCMPTLSSVSCWWSFPGKETAGAQNYHQDRGDFASLNLFVYLTDVDQHSGPHVYCRSTHTYKHLIDALGDIGCVIQQDLFWDWWEQHRKTDKSVEFYFKPQVICGSAGTSFFEDTRGLHKGLSPIKHKRLCFELVWTLVPQFNSKLNQIQSMIESSSKLVIDSTRLAYRY